MRKNANFFAAYTHAYMYRRAHIHAYMHTYMYKRVKILYSTCGFRRFLKKCTTSSTCCTHTCIHVQTRTHTCIHTCRKG